MTILIRLFIFFSIIFTSNVALAYCPTGPIYNGCDGDFNEYFKSSGIKYGRCTGDGPPKNYNASTNSCSDSIKNSSLHFPISEYDYSDAAPAPHPIIAGRFVLPAQHDGKQVLILIKSNNMDPTHVPTIQTIPYPTGCTTSSNIVSCTSTQPEPEEPEGCHTDNSCPYPNDELDLSTGFILDNGGKCTIQGPTCFPVPAAWSNGCVPVHRNSYCDTIDVSDPNYVRPTDLTDPNEIVEPDPSLSVPNPAYPLDHSFQANGTPHWEVPANTGQAAQEYDSSKWRLNGTVFGVQHPQGFGCHITGVCGGPNGVFANRRVDLSTGWTDRNGWACTHKFPSCTENAPARSNGCVPHYMNDNCHSHYIRSNTNCHESGSCFGHWRNVFIDASTGFIDWRGAPCTTETLDCERLPAPLTTGDAVGCIQHESKQPCTWTNDRGDSQGSPYHLLGDVDPEPEPEPGPDGDNTFGFVDFSARLEKGSYGTDANDLLDVAKANYISERALITAQFSDRLNLTLQGSTAASNDNFVTIRGQEANIGVSKWFPFLDTWNFSSLIYFTYAMSAFLILFRRD